MILPISLGCALICTLAPLVVAGLGPYFLIAAVLLKKQLAPAENPLITNLTF
jgi:hypothetical protein